MTSNTLRSFSCLVLAAALTLSACSDSGDPSGPTGSLTMTLTPAAGAAARGAIVETTAAITRIDYTGSLTVTVEGLPDGVTSAVSTQTSGTTIVAMITITVGSTAAVGNTTLTVRAHGSDVEDVTKPFALTVTAPVGNTVTIDVSSCGVKPIWLAAQDGDGLFTRIMPTGDVYTFQLVGARGTVAHVTNSGTSFVLNTNTYDRTTWINGVSSICTPASLSVTGTLAGLAAGTQASVGFGSNGISSIRSTNGAATFTGIRPGNMDVSAWLRGVATDGSGDRGIFRRNQSLTYAVDLGVLDLSGAESFAAVTAPLSITGIVAGEVPGMSMFYHNTVGGRCNTNFLYVRDPATTSFTAAGVPAAQQLATDFHEAFVSASQASGDYRGVGAVFHTMATKAIPLPVALPTITLTPVSGSPYRRMTTSFTVPAEYNGEALLQLFQNGSPARAAQIRVQTSLLAGQNVSLTIPDLSAVTGWDNTWALSNTASGQWSFYAYNDQSLCVEGNRSTFSQRNGVY